MARSWPVDVIPDSNILTDGVYLLSIAGFEERRNRHGGLMYNGEFRVVEPKAYAGSPLYENFSIGTEDDQEAEDPETWKASVGARILKRVFRAAGVEASDDIDGMIASAEGQNVVAIVAREIDDGKNDPKYKGRERNRITGWYAPGEREIKVDGVASGRKPAAAAPKAAPPAARRPAPVVEEADDEPEPVAPPKRGRPKAEQAAPAAAAPAFAGKPPITCDVCGAGFFASKEFVQHVSKEHPEDEE